MKKVHKYIFLLAIVVFFVTALFSKGFHHFDEHYQILEFASLKTGMTTAKDLPWEYESKIRPALQPTIAAGSIKMMKVFGITSPFTQATIFRVLAGLFSLFCIYYLIKSVLPLMGKRYQSIFIFFSFFLYFIPYIAVRFSSETFSVCFFILAFSLALQKYRSQKKTALSSNIIIGLLLGISFVLRYQAAFLVIGLLLWLLIIKKIGIKKILQIIVGAVIAVLVGIMIDYWFYGGFVLTAWNYFDINILQDRAAQWGVHPYNHYYTLFIGVGLTQLISYTIIILTIFYIIFNLKDPVLWVIVPFLVAHSVIGHKELRFIFPIMFFIPYIMIMGWQSIAKLFKDLFILRIIGIIILIPLVSINLLLLAGNMIKPADGQVLVYEYIYANHNNRDTIYYLEERYDFSMMQGSLKMNYYNPYQYEVKKLNTRDIGTLSNIYVIGKKDTTITNLPFKKIHQVLPDWMWNMNKKNWMNLKNSNWVIYEVK